MVKNQIIVTSVVSQGLGVRATAKKYGVSPDHEFVSGAHELAGRKTDMSSY